MDNGGVVFRCWYSCSSRAEALIALLLSMQTAMIPLLKGACNDGGHRRCRLLMLAVLFPAVWDAHRTAAGDSCCCDTHPDGACNNGGQRRYLLLILAVLFAVDSGARRAAAIEADCYNTSPEW